MSSSFFLVSSPQEMKCGGGMFGSAAKRRQQVAQGASLGNDDGKFPAPEGRKRCRFEMQKVSTKGSPCNYWRTPHIVIFVLSPRRVLACSRIKSARLTPGA